MNLDRRNIFCLARLYLRTRSFGHLVALMNACLSYFAIYGANAKIKRIYYTAGIAYAASIGAGLSSELRLASVTRLRSEYLRKVQWGTWYQADLFRHPSTLINSSRTALECSSGERRKERMGRSAHVKPLLPNSAATA